MKAVIIHGPQDIRVEEKPRPVIQEADDAIIRVIVAGICGSELHPYRGHQKTTFGHVMVRIFANYETYCRVITDMMSCTRAMSLRV